MGLSIGKNGHCRSYGSDKIDKIDRTIGLARIVIATVCLVCALNFMHD